MFNKIKLWAISSFAAIGLFTGAAAFAAGTPSPSITTTVLPVVAQIQTDGQAIFDMIFPVIGVFIGLALIVTLFKRFTKKV